MAERGMSPPPPAVHSIMFWLLTGTAMAIFAACVLVPIWQETAQFREYERAMSGFVEQLDQQRARNETHIVALRADPLVNERILRRQLNCRPPGEQLIHWAPGQVRDVHISAVQLPPIGTTASDQGLVASSQPRWVTAIARWLPAWPWQRLFGQAPNRTLMLLMAGGLLLAAFFLYHTPRDRSLTAAGPGNGSAPRASHRASAK